MFYMSLLVFLYDYDFYFVTNFYIWLMLNFQVDKCWNISVPTNNSFHSIFHHFLFHPVHPSKHSMVFCKFYGFLVSLFLPFSTVFKVFP